MFCTIFSKAQVVFCPPGAQWNYEFYSSWFPPYSKNEKVVYVGDTIIGTDTCKILQHSYFLLWCNLHIPKTFIKQKGDTIFFRNQQTEQSWEILYNFAAKKGDTWQTTVKQSNTSLMTYTFTVDSLDFVVYNGHILKRLILAGPGAFEQRQILERIGLNWFVFNYPYTTVSSCKSFMMRELLCYKDSTFEQTMLSELPCDYATSVNSLEENSTRIKISPNPARSGFYLSHNLQNPQQINIEIKDIFGKLVFSTVSSQSANKLYIPIGDLNTGMYLISVKQNDKIIYNSKLIKQN